MTEAPAATTQRRPDRAALSIALFLIAIAAVIVWDMQRIKLGGAYDRIGPTTFPYMVAGGLALLGAWTAVAAWRGSFPARDQQEFGPVLIIVAGLIAQMVLLKITGFTVATAVLFAATAFGFGEKRLHFTVPFGLGLAGLVWFVFARLLKLTLPEGPPEKAFIPIGDIVISWVGALWRWGQILVMGGG